MTLRFILAFLLAFCLIAPLSLAAPEAPQGLLVDLLRRPDLSVITNRTPRFGWIVNDRAPGAVQSAYQIVVSKTQADAQAGKGDCWDSGKTVSNQSIDVSYAGKALESDSTYFWAVRTWDAKDQASPLSAPQRFNAGDFSYKPKWPGESRWVKITGPDGKELWTCENRHPLQYHELPPAQVVKKSDTHTFIDFGKAAFATLKLNLNASSDGEVEIRLGEKIGGDQQVDPKPGGSIFYGSYKLPVKKGPGTYTLQLPRHISKYPNSQILPEHMPEVEPFRYAEVIGPVGEIKAEDVRQVALFYLFDDDASSFTSSDSHLNAVWELCKYTMKATPFMGIYTDGVRERMPYEADAMIQQLGHYCNDREYAIARYSHEYLLYHATWPTEWIMQSVEMAWNDYLYTGNADSLKKNYEVIKAKALVALEREDGLISTKTGKLTRQVMDSVNYTGKSMRDIVDWPQPGEIDHHEFREINTVTNAWHYQALKNMRNITYHLKSNDMSMFCLLHPKVSDSFKARLMDPKTKIFLDGEGATHSSLHANTFSLAFGLADLCGNRREVAAFLKTRDMNCGPYGAQFLLEALYNAGEGDYARALLTSKSERSWTNMIRSGSTMTTEAWDKKFKPNLTWNHAWGAAPANIIPRRLMGVEPIEPGFARARIMPQPGRLASASLKAPTIRGTILVNWKCAENGAIRLEVTIPANMTAEVYVPTSGAEAVRIDPAAGAGCKPLRYDQKMKRAVYEVTGATVAFESPAP